MITAVTELSVSVSVENCEGGSRTVVRLVGDADVTTPALAEILAAETAKKPHLVLVDISGLTFIDSAALHEIVQAHRKSVPTFPLSTRLPNPGSGPDSPAVRARSGDPPSAQAPNKQTCHHSRQLRGRHSRRNL